MWPALADDISVNMDLNSSAVLIRFYQPFSQGGTLLLSRVHKALTQTGSPPSSRDLTDLQAIYVKGGNQVLLEDKAGGFRNEGINFVGFGTPIAFWPPPLAGPDVGSSSVCWECEIPDEKINEALAGEDIKSLIQSDNAVFYRRCIFNLLLTTCLTDKDPRYFANGLPSRIWMLRAVVEKDKRESFTITVGEDQYTWTLVGSIGWL